MIKMKQTSTDIDTANNIANPIFPQPRQPIRQIIAKSQLPMPYCEAERIYSNKLKGNKLHISQFRQKQQLKVQAINHHNSIRGYLQNMTNDDYLFNDQRTMGQSAIINQTLGDSFRPKTGAITADPTVKTRRKRFQQDISIQRKQEMMITSSGARPKTNSVTHRTRTYFISNNLDNKTNDYMNLVIRNQSKTENQSEKMLGKIHTEGMIPHAKKLNSFQRRMRKGKKVKSLSKQKYSPTADLRNLSQTLQTVKAYDQSPLVTNIDFKTSFAPLFHLRAQAKKKHIY